MSELRKRLGPIVKAWDERDLGEKEPLSAGGRPGRKGAQKRSGASTRRAYNLRDQQAGLPEGFGADDLGRRIWD